MGTAALVVVGLIFVVYGGYRRFGAQSNRTPWFYAAAACALAFVFVITALLVRAAS